MGRSRRMSHFVRLRVPRYMLMMAVREKHISVSGAQYSIGMNASNHSDWHPCDILPF